MAKNYKTGILITGDSSKGVRAVKLTREEVTKLNASQKRGASQAKRYAAAQSQAGASLKKAGIVLAAGAVAMTAMTKKALNSADAIGKQADQVGLSTDAWQEYLFAASQSGVSQEKLTSGMGALNKRVGELKQGTGSLTTFLKKYDEELYENVKAAGSTEEAAKLIFDAMGKAETSMDRAALSAAAFSRGAGIEMQNMVRGGSDALVEMRREAQELGIVLDESLIRGAEDANDQLDIMSRIVSANVTKALLDLAPALVAAATAFADITKGISDFYAIYKMLAGEVDRDALQTIGDQMATLKDESVALYTGVVQAKRKLKSITDEESAAYRDQFGILQGLKIEYKANQDAQDALLKKKKQVVAATKDEARAVANNVKQYGGSVEVLTEAEKAMQSYSKSVISAEIADSILLDKHALLDQLFMDGIITSKTYADQLGVLTGVTKEVADATDVAIESSTAYGETITDEVSGGMADAIVAGDDFGDSMENLWKRMAADWANAGLAQMFGSLFSGGGFDTTGFSGFGGGGSSGGGIVSSVGSSAAGKYIAGSPVGQTVSGWFGGGASSAATYEASTTAMLEFAPAAEEAAFQAMQVESASSSAGAGMTALGAAAGVVAVGMYMMNESEKRNAEITAEVTAKMAEAEVVISNSSLTFAQWGTEGVAQLNMATEQSGVLQYAMRELGAELEYSKTGAIHISEGFDQAAIAATAFTDSANAQLQKLVEKEMEVTDGQYDYALSVTEAQAKVGKAWGQNLAMLDATGQGIDELTGEMVSGVDTMQGAIDSLSGVDIISTHTLRNFTYVEGGYGETGYADGGISTGPMSGHMELLHGTEAVIPLKNGSIPVDVRSTGADSKEVADLLKTLIKEVTRTGGKQIDALNDQTKLLIKRETQAAMRELQYA